MKNISTLFVVFFCSILVVHATSDISSPFALSVSEPDTIPFTLSPYNTIDVQVVVNNMDTMTWMFHTAIDHISITKEAAKKCSSITFDKAFDGANSWGGDDGQMRSSVHNKVSFGSISLDSLSIDEVALSGKKTDGKFGPSIFGEKVIEIDYDRGWLIVHSAVPEYANQFQKFPLEIDRGMYFLNADIGIGKDSVFTHNFLIHSGYSGTVLLDDKFVQQHHIDQVLKMISEKDLKDSFGNIIKTKKVVLPLWQIGNYQLVDIPAGYFIAATNRQNISVLGGGILKRFTILLDLVHDMFYIQPNSFYNSSYND